MELLAHLSVEIAGYLALRLLGRLSKLPLPPLPGPVVTAPHSLALEDAPGTGEVNTDSAVGRAQILSPPPFLTSGKA